MTGKLNVICGSDIGMDLIAVLMMPEGPDNAIYLKSIEQIFSRSSVNLNQLLDTAKQAELEFKEIELSGADGPQVHPYINAADSAWTTLYRELQLVSQFNLITADRVVKVRTIGLLYNTHRLSYSETADSEYVLGGIDLMSVESIENT